MRGWARVIAFGCTHWPIADPDTFKWRIEQIREFKPDWVINLGDWMDADAASRWPSEHKWTLADEYRAVAGDADAVRLAAPKARRVWLMGNHDDNLQAPCRIPEKLREVASWRNDKGLAKALHGWRIVPYGHREFFRLGQVTFQHGSEAGAQADQRQCLLYGVQNGLWVGAHTHRPVSVTQVILPGKIPMPYWFANAGTGADWGRMHYIARQNIATWGSAVVKLLVNTSHNRHNWASPQWSANPQDGLGVKFYKMAHSGAILERSGGF